MKKSVFTSFLATLAFVISGSLLQAEILNVEKGSQVDGVNVQQNQSGVVVNGTVNRGVASHRVPGSHVHVQLLDSKGKSLGTVSNSLTPKAPKRDARRNYRVKYSAGFPAAEATKASTVRVLYKNHSHAVCVAPVKIQKCPSC